MVLTLGGLELPNRKDNQAWGFVTRAFGFATNLAAAFFAILNKFSIGVKARAIYLVAVPFSQLFAYFEKKGIAGL